MLCIKTVRPKFHTPLCVQGTSHLALVCLYLHVHNRTHIFIKYIDTLRAKLLYRYTIKISIVKSHCSSSITSKAIEQAFKMERSRGGLSWLMWKQMDQKSYFFLVAIWQVLLGEALCGCLRFSQGWTREIDVSSIVTRCEYHVSQISVILNADPEIHLLKDIYVSNFLWRLASFLINTKDKRREGTCDSCRHNGKRTRKTGTSKGETTMSGSFWAYLGTSWMFWHHGESSLSYSSREVHALNIDTRESHLNISSSPNQMFHPKPRTTLDFIGFALL